MCLRTHNLRKTAPLSKHIKANLTNIEKFNSIKWKVTDYMRQKTVRNLQYTDKTLTRNIEKLYRRLKYIWYRCIGLTRVKPRGAVVLNLQKAVVVVNSQPRLFKTRLSSNDFSFYMCILGRDENVARQIINSVCQAQKSGHLLVYTEMIITQKSAYIISSL